MSTEQWITLGRFGRVHGIKGWITVISFTEPRENIFNYDRWFIYRDDTWVPVLRIQDNITAQHLLVQIQGYETRESLQIFTQHDIAVPKSDLPSLPEDEYYWHDLIGMRVIHEHHTVLGVVRELIETGSHDVLIVEGESRHLIPYIKDVILAIDKEKRDIHVSWHWDP